MRGGHNRVPDVVKELRGTKQKCRTNPDAPVVVPGKVPAPPKGMRKEAKQVWRDLAEAVGAQRVYSPAFMLTFRLTVDALVEALHPDPREPPTARVRMMQVASGLLQRWGLDPASVGRVSALKAEKASGHEAVPVLGLAPAPGEVIELPDRLDA